MAKAVERIGNEIRINISPRQHAAMICEADDMFYGGAAGGGKSYFLLLFAAQRRMKFPNSQGLLLRRTFRELENSLILESRKIYPVFGAVYNELKKRWLFPNGSIQQFGYCESDGDVYQYQSANYDDIGFDELTHMTQFQFAYITSRCRTTIPGCKALIRSASNPGNVGHDWVNKRYVIKGKIQPIWTDSKTGKTMAFIPAQIVDNPYLKEADPGYYDRLKELPENKFLALAEGRWDVFEGAYFTEFDSTKHILKIRRIPDTHTLKFLSLDWGFSDPACVLWWEVTPMGRVFIYRELYINRLHPRELGAEILKNCPDYEKYEWMAASPEIWGKSADLKEGGETIHQSLQKALGDRIVMQKAMNARIPGWLKMREWMGLANDGAPWLQISPCCENLIRTIPTAVHAEPPKDPEDIDTACEDHALESCVIATDMVDLPQGPKPIAELVGTTGVLWTVGGWRAYRDVRQTGKNVPVFKMESEDGRSITGTFNHPILTSHGWAPLGSLKAGDQIMDVGQCKSSSLLKNVRNSMVFDIICAVSIFKEKVKDCTGKFGNSIIRAKRFLSTFMFITKTGIVSITSPTTWRSSTKRLISRNTWPPRKPENDHVVICMKTFSPRELLGTKTRPIDSAKLRSAGLRQNTSDLKQPSPTGRNKSYLALSAGMTSLFKLGIPGNIVETPAKCVSIGKAIGKLFGFTTSKGARFAGIENVYNMEVDEVHCFSLNGGLLVHNCRYGAVSLMGIPRGANGAHPNMGQFDRVFGTGEKVHNQSHLPETGRGGY